jgi:hypothetical protein
MRSFTSSSIVALIGVVVSEEDGVAQGGVAPFLGVCCNDSPALGVEHSVESSSVSHPVQAGFAHCWWGSKQCGKRVGTEGSTTGSSSSVGLGSPHNLSMERESGLRWGSGFTLLDGGCFPLSVVVVFVSLLPERSVSRYVRFNTFDELESPLEGFKPFQPLSI